MQRPFLSRGFAIAVAVAGLVLLAGTAAGANPKDPQKRHTTADTKLAKSIALKLSDLQAGWTADRGATTSSTICSAQPDESKLVETADVDPSFTYKDKATNVGSEVQLFRTAANARTDWRFITLAALKTCVVEEMRRELGKSARADMTAAKALPLHASTERVFQYRFALTLHVNSKTVPVVMQFVGVGKGRASVFFHIVSFGPPPPASFLTPFVQLFAGRLNAAPTI
jgi:hypothetical protein